MKKICAFLALLLSLVFLASAQWENLVAGVVALAVGAVIYRFRRPAMGVERS